MGTILVCHFSTCGWLPPIWETASRVNILALFSLSVTLSCRGAYHELGCWTAQKVSACLSWVRPCSGHMSLLHFSLHTLLPFHCRERNLILISVNQVQIYSYTFVARKQSLGFLSRLLCSPYWKLYSALFPSSFLYVPVTKQPCSIFQRWYAENKI